MKPLIAKVRPASGYAQLAHLALSALLPIIVYILIAAKIPAQAALAVILLSKWRMLAVKPRFWLAHIRTNSVDIIVNISFLTFMSQVSNSPGWLIFWTVMFIIWMVVIKPATQLLMVAIQALIGLSLGLIALYLVGGTWHLLFLVAATGLICYMAAHHFFDAFEEAYTRLLSFVWAWFGASMAWVLGHWLLYYGDELIAQPALLLIAIGYSLAALYYLEHKDRLSHFMSRQFIFIMVAITAIILTFSDWGDKIV